MRFLRSVLLAGLGFALVACGKDDPVRPSGPVTLIFAPKIFSDQPGTATDTVKGILIVDGVDTLDVPYDTLPNLSRGEHTFELHTNVDYLPSRYTRRVDPNSRFFVVQVAQEGTCRVFRAGSEFIDADFCARPGGERRNALLWSQHQRIFCPAGDFLEYCARYPDFNQLGLTWPADSANRAYESHEYVTHPKLLLAGTVGAELTANVGDRKVATALYRPGDYSPRRRLRVAPADSSRYSNVVWTDARYLPIYNFTRGQLNDEARARRNELLGLEVKVTYLLPASQKDALVIRYDIRNISQEADYRRVHPDVPASGFTVTNLYVTPALDPDIGGTASDEFVDDAATVFPADRLIAAYDRNFQVTNWLAPYRTAPGIVGFQALATNIPGTPRAVILGRADTLDYRSLLSTAGIAADEARELATFRSISAGREGAAIAANCTLTTDLYDCTPESNDDVRVGWSFGPIASVPPGQTYSVTVAILLAAPQPGTFTSGTAIAPNNDQVGSTTRPIHAVTQRLRALAAQVAPLTVTPVP